MDAIPDGEVNAKLNSQVEETAYLLASPANADRLRMSIADAEAGRTMGVAMERIMTLAVHHGQKQNIDLTIPRHGLH